VTQREREDEGISLISQQEFACDAGGVQLRESQLGMRAEVSRPKSETDNSFFF
jgi:hypothetical protein